MTITVWGKLPTVVRAILVFLVSYIALSAVFLMNTPRVTGWLMPLYTVIIERTYPQNELVSIVNNGTSISYEMKIHTYIKGTDLPLVDNLTDSIHASFQFVTLIIYYSLLLAWPAISTRKKIASIFLFFPILLLFILIDIPVTIISSIDFACMQKLHGIPLADSFSRKAILFLSHFINNGGRQFFAVMLFALTVFPLRMRASPKKRQG